MLLAPESTNFDINKDFKETILYAKLMQSAEIF